MDLARISKAIAGGFAGIATGAAGTGIVYVQLPPNVLPQSVYVALPLVNAAIGFIVGFWAVYKAPANTPAK